MLAQKEITMTGLQTLFPRSSFVGFDHLFNELEWTAKHAQDHYPPHNIIKSGDQEFEDNEEKLVLDMKSFLYLAGTELDFSDGLNGKGFQFNNPNATRTCGCGESFAV